MALVTPTVDRVFSRASRYCYCCIYCCFSVAARSESRCDDTAVATAAVAGCCYCFCQYPYYFTETFTFTNYLPFSYSCSLHRYCYQIRLVSWLLLLLLLISVQGYSRWTPLHCCLEPPPSTTITSPFNPDNPFNRAVGHWFKFFNHCCHHCEQPERSGGPLGCIK